MAATLSAIVLLAIGQTPILDRVADASRGHPVYVDPATHRLTGAEARRLERQIDEEARGPVLIAILPEAALREGNGTAEGVAVELSRRIFTTNPPAVYAVVVDGRFAAINRDISAGELATAATQAHGNEGLAAVLSDFIRRVGQARAPAAVVPENDGSSKRGFLLAAAVGLAIVFAVFLWMRR